MRYIKRITVCSLMVLLLYLLAVFFYFLSSSGKVRPENVIDMRVNALQHLKEAVENKLETPNDYQNPLLEIYNDLETQHLLISPTNTNKILIRNYSDFDKLSDYVFYKNGQRWFIVELYTDVIYPYPMLIDETGTICVIKKLEEN